MECKVERGDDANSIEIGCQNNEKWARKGQYIKIEEDE
jgi:hypothetical protein